MVEYKVFPLSLAIELLGSDLITDSFKEFSCSADTDLEDFLNEKAIDHEQTMKGRTFLLVDQNVFEESGAVKIIAYYTLANTAIDLSNFSDTKKRKIVGNYPNRTQTNYFPAFLIGQLGRDDHYGHDDLSGNVILNEAYHTLSKAAEILGGKVVVLECREHMFEKVYAPLGYKKMVNELNDNHLFMLYKRVDFCNC